MNKALLDPPRSKRQPDSDQIPYGPGEWGRRLAEARAKRRAVLAERASTAPADPAKGRPRRDPLARLAPRRSADFGESAAAVARTARPWATSIRRGTVPAFLAGCLVGAAITGVITVAIGTAILRNVETAAAPDRPPLAASSRPAVAAPANGAPLRQDDPDVATAAMAPRAISPADPPRDAGDGSAARPDAPSRRPDDARGAMQIAAPGAPLPPPGNAVPPDPAVARVPPGALADAAAGTAATGLAAPTTGWHDLAAARPIAPAPAPEGPPAGPESRVVTLAPASVSSGARAETVAALRADGWSAGDARSSSFTVSRTHVRYYHAEDGPAAARLATRFGAEARDFTGYGRRPEPGTLEIWLAGRTAARQAPLRQDLPAPVRFIANTFGRLSSGGTHGN